MIDERGKMRQDNPLSSRKKLHKTCICRLDMQTLIKYLNNVQLVFIIEKKFQKNRVNAYGKQTIHPSPQTLVKGMTQCQKIMSIT